MKQDPNLLPRSKPDKQVSEEVDPGKGHYENLQASSPSTRLNNPQRVGWDGGWNGLTHLIPQPQPPLIAMAGSMG